MQFEYSVFKSQQKDSYHQRIDWGNISNLKSLWQLSIIYWVMEVQSHRDRISSLEQCCFFQESCLVLKWWILQPTVCWRLKFCCILKLLIDILLQLVLFYQTKVSLLFKPLQKFEKSNQSSIWNFHELLKSAFLFTSYDQTMCLLKELYCNLFLRSTSLLKFSHSQFTANAHHLKLQASKFDLKFP